MSRGLATSTVFHAIADSTRRSVLRALGNGECTVTDLLRVTRASQSALSQHLAVLRRARLVAQRQEGRYRWYRVRRPTPLRQVANWVEFFERFWEVRFRSLEGYLDRRR